MGHYSAHTLALVGALGSRDGIEAARAERSTPEQAPKRQQRTFEDAVLQDSLAGEFGAGGIKSAGRREKRRNQELIRPYRGHKDVSAYPLSTVSKNRSSSCRSRAVSKLVAPCKGMKTISTPGGILARFSLKYSLSLLLIRFLAQAFPLFLPTAIPSRGFPI